MLVLVLVQAGVARAARRAEQTHDAARGQVSYICPPALVLFLAETAQTRV